MLELNAFSAAAVSASFMDILTKEEKDAALEKRMEEIRKKNKEREERHKEIAADKRYAEELNASVSAGTPDHNRHSKGIGSAAGGGDSQMVHESAGPSGGWGSASYRDDWPARDEADEQQYWQQSRQRGGRESHSGQWTRGGSAVAHGTRTVPADARERLANSRGRRPDLSRSKEDTRAYHADSGMNHASGGYDPSSVTASSVKGNSVSAATVSQHDVVVQQKSESVVRSGDPRPDVAATAAQVGSIPSAGIGTGRGRGRGIVVPPEVGLHGQASRSADRAVSRGESQVHARHIVPSPQQHERHVPERLVAAEAVDEAGSPQAAPQDVSKRVRGDQQRSDANFQQPTDSRRSGEPSGRRYPGQQQSAQPTDRAQRQYEAKLHNQQNYEEIRKKNAAAYEESLRSSAGNATGSCGGFLADRSRDVQTDYSRTNEEIRHLKQQQANVENSTTATVRHQRNFGGANADLELVKSKVKEVAHERQENHRGKPLELQMTGHERQQYTAWREDRDRIDRARLDRARGTGGNWRRAWDADKSAPLGSSAAPHERSRDDAEVRYRGSKDQSDTQRTQRRSPDHGGDRTAHADRARARTSEECDQPVSLTATVSKHTPGRQELPKRNKRRKNKTPMANENQALGSDSRASGRGSNPNLDKRGGGNETGASIGSLKIRHDGSGDGVHNVLTGSPGQSLPAVPSAKVEESPASVDDLTTSTVAPNVAETLNLPTADHETGAVSSGAPREAVSNAHTKDDDDEWEDVDDEDDECEDDDEDCDLSELDSSSQRHVTDWAAEVENEFGSS